MTAYNKEHRNMTKIVQKNQNVIQFIFFVGFLCFPVRHTDNRQIRLLKGSIREKDFAFDKKKAKM